MAALNVSNSVSSGGFLRIDHSFIILEPHHLSFSLILCLLLHALLKLRLESFFAVHVHLRLCILLLLLISLQWALVRVVTLLLTVEADNTHVLHLTDWVHHLNLSQFRLSDFFFLAVGRFVAFHSATMANNSLLTLPHEMILPTMHRLIHMNLAIKPILLTWEVSQSRE